MSASKSRTTHATHVSHTTKSHSAPLVESASGAGDLVTGAAPAAPASSLITTMSDTAVKECGVFLNEVLVRIGTQEPLGQVDILHATKMKRGGAQIIPKILALCEKHDVTKIGSLTTAEMSAELKRGDALQQVGVTSALVQKKVRESAMTAHGRTWQIGTTMYKTLKRLAVDDPELALGLKPIEAFFKSQRGKGTAGSKKKAGATATKVAVATEPTEPTSASPVTAAPAITAPEPATPAPAEASAQAAPAVSTQATQAR